MVLTAVTEGVITSASAMSPSSDAMMKKDDAMMMKKEGDAMMMKKSIDSNLSMGSKGEQVTALQTMLEEGGFLVLPAGASKGFFGKATKAALIRYQASVGISATGFFGPLTRSALSKGMMKGDGMMKKDGDAMMKKEGVLVGGALMVRNLDIVDNAVNASNVTTVVAAVKAAGLVDTLKSKGPFTVFAPTNDAFAKLPAGTVDTLVKPENKATLVDILTYHVVAGRFTVADLSDGQTLTTVQGKTLKISKVNGKVTINGSVMIETADVISSNGVTHVIDTVLIAK